jgi:hypothetical protein
MSVLVRGSPFTEYPPNLAVLGGWKLGERRVSVCPLFAVGARTPMCFWTVCFSVLFEIGRAACWLGLGIQLRRYDAKEWRDGNMKGIGLRRRGWVLL